MNIVRALMACALAAALSLVLVNGASAASAKGSPIVIGTICTCSGPSGADIAGVKTIVTSWVKWKNANGGVNGHPVKVVFKDDKGDATASAAAARALVSAKVKAIVGNFSLQEGTWLKIAHDAGIPVIGTSDQSPVEASDANVFPLGSNNITTLYHVVKNASDDGNKKLSMMYCTEVPTCGQLKPIIDAFTKTLGTGIKVVSEATISASQPSYSANCLSGKNAGGNAAILIAPAVTNNRLIPQCTQQGWKPTQYGANGSLAHKDVSIYKGGVKVALSLPSISVDDRSTPGMKLFASILTKYAPKLQGTAQYNDSLSMPFASLQLFAKVGDQSKLKPTSTTGQVKSALYRANGQTLGGLVAPLKFTRGKGTDNSCAFISRFNGKKWVANPKPSCLSAARLALLHKNIGF